MRTVTPYNLFESPRRGFSAPAGRLVHWQQAQTLINIFDRYQEQNELLLNVPVVLATSNKHPEPRTIIVDSMVFNQETPHIPDTAYSSFLDDFLIIYHDEGVATEEIQTLTDFIPLEALLHALKLKFADYYEGEEMGFFLHEGFHPVDKIRMTLRTIIDLESQPAEWRVHPLDPEVTEIKALELNTPVTESNPRYKFSRLLTYKRNGRERYSLEYIRDGFYYLLGLYNVDLGHLETIATILKNKYPAYYEGEEMGFFLTEETDTDGPDDDFGAGEALKKQAQLTYIQSIVVTYGTKLRLNLERDFIFGGANREAYELDVNLKMGGWFLRAKKILVETDGTKHYGGVVTFNNGTTRNLWSLLDKDLQALYDGLQKTYPEYGEAKEMGFFLTESQSPRSELKRQLKIIVKIAGEKEAADENWWPNWMLTLPEPYRPHGSSRYQYTHLGLVLYPPGQESLVLRDRDRGENAHTCEVDNLTTPQLKHLYQLVIQAYPDVAEGQEMGFFLTEGTGEKEHIIKAIEGWLDQNTRTLVEPPQKLRMHLSNEYGHKIPTRVHLSKIFKSPKTDMVQQWGPSYPRSYSYLAQIDQQHTTRALILDDLPLSALQNVYQYLYQLDPPFFEGQEMGFFLTESGEGVVMRTPVDDEDAYYNLITGAIDRQGSIEIGLTLPIKNKWAKQVAGASKRQKRDVVRVYQEGEYGTYCAQTSPGRHVGEISLRQFTPSALRKIWEEIYRQHGAEIEGTEMGFFLTENNI